MITLTEYQINAIHKIKDEHGLLLWWKMGTGKTIAGLTLMLNYPDYDVVIICPQEIKFVWEHEHAKIPTIKNKITYYYHNQLKSLPDLTNKLVIVDEAHHLMEYKDDIPFSNFNKCYKILLLSGTPVYTKMSDLIYLVNIAAGKEIVPYNSYQFHKRYYIIKRFKSVSHGWIGSISNMTIKVVSTFMAVYSVLLLAATKLGWLENENGILFNYFLPRIFQISLKLQKVNGDIRELSEEDRDYINRMLSPEDKKQDNMSDKIKLIIKRIFGKYIFYIIAVVVIMYLSSIYYKLFKYKIEDYRYFSYTKLANDIKNNAYYYDNKNDVSNVEYYPVDTYEIKYVPYSHYQLGLWLELTQNCLGIESIKDLKLSNNPGTYTEQLDDKTYYSKGKFIGNLSDKKDYSPKFYEILKKANGTRAVVYSQSLELGSLPFMNFLKDKNINYLFLDDKISSVQKTHILERFKNETLILVLHPVYTEGVSILGARQMHIMEPIEELATKQQLIARVSRYMSHGHLPKNERRVNIYQWACESKTLNSKIVKVLHSMKKWFKINNEVSYFEKYTRYSQDVTPDSFILKKELIQSKELRDLEHTMYEKTIKYDCCIKYPSQEQENECLSKKPSCRRHSRSLKK